jgi:hypothetical protein
LLALTDQGFAHLAIAATAIAPQERARWLREIAAELDPPTVPTKIPRREARSPAAARQAKLRANRKAGRHSYRMWISDRAVEGLIVRCVLEGRLTEEQAMRPKLVALALAALLEEEGQRLAR